MRVIAGSARRIPLVAPAGEGTRPTTDRIKETLFNILQDEVPGCRFLDLFAGSGGIGIEALSRGAREAVFVEKDRAALRCIRENLAKTRLEAQATVCQTDYTMALSQLNRSGEPFDIIFADPPYRKGYGAEILRLLSEEGAASRDTLIILESAIETDMDFVDTDRFDIERVKEYKTNRHIFLKKRTD